MKETTTTDQEVDTNDTPKLQLVGEQEAIEVAEDASELRGQVREAMARLDLTKKDVADQVGLSRAALSRWLDAKYAGSDEKIAAAVEKWLSSVPEFRGGGYIETPSSEKIFSTLAYCQGFQDMVMIFGGPGVGKTTTIRRFCDLFPGRAWVATMTPACSGLVSALQAVSEALGVGVATGGARAISTAIRRRLSEERYLLLIIDESQHLTMPAIEELRSIHDATEVGLALVGNETSYSRLMGGKATAQISSRIGVHLNIQRPTDEDVAAVCDAWNVTDEQARKLLRSLADRPGALRSVYKVLRLVTRNGKQVTGQSVAAACRQLGAEL